MSIVTEKLAACSARLSADGRKIVLGPGPAAWTEFCQSLPGARWNQFDCRWTCDPTPAAVWRVCNRGEVCPKSELRRISDAYQNQLRCSALLLMQPIHLKTQPWEHQQKAYARTYPLDAAMLALDMGVGKTKVAVDLLVNWNCRTILILCPLSVRGVWRREIERHAAHFIEVVIPDKGTVKQKTKVAAEAMKLAAAMNRPVAVVMNYDAAKIEPFAAWSIEQQWDCVILDESHRAKAHNSQTSKYCAKLGRVAKRRLCLTGTPLGQSPLDLFGQFRFLDPGLFGTSWHHFSNRYAIKGNPYIPQQITGYKNQEELQERMGLITYRCKAADVLDLPEAMHEERTFELSKPARKAYRDLEEELITNLGAGIVTASNALVRLLRLQQITSGFLVEDETEIVHGIDTGKADILADLIDDLGCEPLVVFCRFKHDLAAVRRICESKKIRYGELSGAARDGLTDRSEMSPTIDVLGCQIQSGGVGIDLTRARYAVYYSLGFSLTEYEQSLARLHRPGQTRNVIYYHLLAENTVDQRVFAALRARKDVIEAVLEGMR